MINGKKVIVVLPAYNAAKTLEKTYQEIPFDIVDDVILVDENSKDTTAAIAEKLGIRNIIVHEKNKGYGGNQKTCYDKALSLNADIVVMLHPDYQYTPKLIQSIAFIIANDIYPVVFASRILSNGALKGGMPWYKYVANRMLTLFQNILLNQKLSEYHTGYRAFSREVLQNVNYKRIYDMYGENGLKNGVTNPLDGSHSGSYVFSGNSIEIFEEFFGSKNPYTDNFFVSTRNQ